jgi:hypothetical protein
MILSFFFAGGAFINGIFMIISGGLKNPGSLKIFIIAACFFLSGKILLSVIERRRKMSQGKKNQKD